MTATSDLSSTLAKLKELAADLPSAMRQTVETMIQQCMEEEVSDQIGAKRHARSCEREAHRNGYRLKTLETQLGKLNIRIPRLREGSYFPSFLEPRVDSTNSCRLDSTNSCRVLPPAA